jgi:DNA topoisomerase I
LAEAKQRPAAPSGRALGDHPRDGKPVTLNSGRFGPYVKHGKTMASLPKAMAAAADELTLEQAIELLNAKEAKDGTKVPAKKATKAKAEAPAPETKKSAEPKKAAEPKKKATTAKKTAEPKPATKARSRATATGS